MRVKYRVTIIVMALLRQRITFFLSNPTLCFMQCQNLFANMSTSFLCERWHLFADMNCGDTFSRSRAINAIGGVVVLAVA